MHLQQIPQDFSICQVSDLAFIDHTDPFSFISKTDEEISLVCGTDKVPQNAIRRSDGWRAFRIQGELDFSLVGILSAIFAILAENKIGIFAVSTYKTDYILTKEQDFARALEALKQAGYIIT